MTQDNSTAQLLPCPFCGDNNTMLAGERSVYVKCRSCDARGGDERTPHAAKTAWNTRAPVSQDAEQLVERLRQLLAKATPGPWYHYDEIFRPMFGKRRITEIQRDKDGQTLIKWTGFDGLDGSANRKRNANARLIVEAVNALPELLDRLSRV